ncbi:hypothetical protein BJF85_21795 [Saccharomonospora sp. CUA-673]|uniref:hypothetical protein n=1 Tax=Saccharomonospora sp. CUA-673 TaxID=1904969 RepID=UPI00095E2B84|nr:hypothetical protein [Saccharomonospora sp. CUA-673]OLT43614.1 hypothetical protein BJF85_21795 [Saccharomonospora sp. CUA-673]
MSTRFTAAALAGLGVFQTGLAAGAPWGHMAYGGGHPGTLPAPLRRVSGAAAVGYVVAAGLVATRRGSVPARRRGLTGLAAFMAFGTALNAVSRSPTERVWAPVCAATAVAAWRARPESQQD